MAETFLIGDWRFDARCGELMRDAARHKLEDRSSRTLELLCDHAGDLVAKSMIVGLIWNGRHVSENSLAVVIADLRRTLGDDARRPRYIETIAKRGYRLIAPVAENAPAVGPARDDGDPDGDGAGAVDADERPKPAPIARRPASRWWIALVMLLVVFGGLSIMSRAGSPERLTLVTGPVANETGNPGYGPLSHALGELVRDQAAAMPGITVVDGPAAPTGATTVRLSARLIIWNSTPTLSLTADGVGWEVLWSAMAVGRPDTIAAVTIGKLNGLRALLESCRRSLGRDPAGDCRPA